MRSARARSPKATPMINAIFGEESELRNQRGWLVFICEISLGRGRETGERMKGKGVRNKGG
jgi:hypothetical protein